MKIVQAFAACSDLTGYAKFASTKSPEEIFNLLSEYYEFLGRAIEPANGRVIKFMGDTALMMFEETDADAGVKSLLALQMEGDRFLSERGMRSRHNIHMHFGPICIGDLGTREDKRIDILGNTVNTLFLLKSTSSFAITPEAFRKLSPETRKIFKKHTPPITYIPLNQHHKD